jgi:hypothetical protein
LNQAWDGHADTLQVLRSSVKVNRYGSMLGCVRDYRIAFPGWSAAVRPRVARGYIAELAEGERRRVNRPRRLGPNGAGELRRGVLLPRRAPCLPPGFLAALCPPPHRDAEPTPRRLPAR